MTFIYDLLNLFIYFCPENKKPKSKFIQLSPYMCLNKRTSLCPRENLSFSLDSPVLFMTQFLILFRNCFRGLMFVRIFFLFLFQRIRHVCDCLIMGRANVFNTVIFLFIYFKNDKGFFFQHQKLYFE